MNTKDITAILEYQLSQDRSSIGRRLRSERELASLFDSPAWRVRTSLNRLERRGIISRHWGSGTYVRRHVYEAMRLAPDLVTRIPRESIYAETSGTGSIIREPETRERYQIGLWGDLRHWSMTNQKVLASMTTRAGELGQRLSMHSMVNQLDKNLSPGDIRKELRGDPSDVYIVTLSNSDEFYEAVGNSNDRVVYFYPGTPGVDSQLQFWPLVMFDTGNAMRMGLHLLYEQGYRRIAYVFCRPQIGRAMESVYRNALQSLGLSYCMPLPCTLDMSEGVPELKGLLASEDSPDAIFVGDDHLMPIVDEVLRQKGISPGSQVGLLTVSNRGCSLPGSHSWSRMEFDPEQLGRRVIDVALEALRHPERPIMNESIQPRWIPGISHLRGGTSIE